MAGCLVFLALFTTSDLATYGVVTAGNLGFASFGLSLVITYPPFSEDPVPGF
jgi:hypothetical protein